LTPEPTEPSPAQDVAVSVDQLKALSEPSRLRILTLLMERDMSIPDIARAPSLSPCDGPPPWRRDSVHQVQEIFDDARRKLERVAAKTRAQGSPDDEVMALLTVLPA